jgi:hypothetical protein
MKEMSQAEKINYFKIALALVGVNADERTCDVIVSTYERLLKLGADFSVHDAVAIKMQNEANYPPTDLEK